MTDTISKFIQENSELCERATRGPWSEYNNGFDAGVVSNMRKAIGDYHYKDKVLGKVEFDEWICGGEPHEGHFDGPDAKFVAHSRTALPKALKALEIAVERLKMSHELRVMNDPELVVTIEQMALTEIEELLNDTRNVSSAMG